MIQLRRSYFEEIDEDKIGELFELIAPYIQGRRERYKFYSRKENPAELMQARNDILMSWERYITVMADGCFAGIAPKYSVRDSLREGAAPEQQQIQRDEYQKLLDDIHNFNDDGSKYSKAMHYFNTTGAAYLHIYENENNEIEYAALDSRNTVAIYDFSIEPKLIAVIRQHYEGEEKWLEIITSEWRRQYNEDAEIVPFEVYTETGQMQELDEVILQWGDVPVVAFEHPDGIAIYEPVLDLIDFAENAMANVKNMTEYNDNAKLVVHGHQTENAPLIMNDYGQPTVNPMWEREIDMLYQARALFHPSEGDTKWLIKNVDYKGIIDYVREIMNYIMLLSITPNLTDQSFSGNTSGVAHGYKLFAPKQIGAFIYGIFKAGYMRKLRIITERLNLYHHTDFNFRDVDIHFVHNIPTDERQRMDMGISAHRFGLLSHETAIGISGAVDYPAEEMARIAAEREQDYNAAMQPVDTDQPDIAVEQISEDETEVVEDSE